MSRSALGNILGEAGGDLVARGKFELHNPARRAARYGSRHSLADQGDLGVAAESGALVVPAGAGLVATPQV